MQKCKQIFLCPKFDKTLTIREPIFITKNGYGDMVLMSMETFEKSSFFNTLYSHLAESEADLKAGRVSDVDDAINACFLCKTKL